VAKTETGNIDCPIFLSSIFLSNSFLPNSLP